MANGHGLGGRMDSNKPSSAVLHRIALRTCYTMAMDEMMTGAIWSLAVVQVPTPTMIFRGKFHGTSHALHSVPIPDSKHSVP